MNFLPSDEVTAIRNRIDHPIVDSDGHLIEYLPLVRDFLVEEAGEDVAKGFDQMVKSAGQRAAVPSPGRGCCASAGPRGRRRGCRAGAVARVTAPRPVGPPT